MNETARAAEVGFFSSSDVKVAGEFQTVSKGEDILTNLDELGLLLMDEPQDTKKEMKQTGDNYPL